ncbi:MAG TPA: PRC-barrel domain-containing protein, partial [Blastocatellia bacterium]|nr:PRC-barrel domain-containing protein [Blastocatellia bacterium]
MLQSLKNILNYHIHAKNGSIGRVADFYFDDKAWRTMYLVADCGNWVMGHQKVLIEPQYFDHTDQTEGRLYLNLTQEQVEDSPNIETHTPISKQPLSLKIFTPMSFHHNDKPALLGMINPGDRHLC